MLKRFRMITVFQEQCQEYFHCNNYPVAVRRNPLWRQTLEMKESLHLVVRCYQFSQAFQGPQ